MKFKTEVILLIVAIMLFAASMFCYSYKNTTTSDTKIITLSSVYPYRTIAVAFVGIASLSLVTASLSYSKKTKQTTLTNC